MSVRFVDNSHFRVIRASVGGLVLSNLGKYIVDGSHFPAAFMILVAVGDFGRAERFLSDADFNFKSRVFVVGCPAKEPFGVETRVAYGKQLQKQKANS